MSSIILIHLAGTLFMTGVIWVIQLLHYPSFEFFPEEDFPSKMKWHQSQVSWLVIPTMLIELITGAYIAWRLGFSDLVWNVNLGLIALVWISTGFLQGPTHGKLLLGKDLINARFLNRTNWVRVGLWSIRSAGLLYFMV
ncbi:MAG: hypothetical protein R2877_03305 [Bdellovibrionota bacterium]